VNKNLDLNQYDFSYPEDLVGIRVQKPCRVMCVTEEDPLVNKWGIKEHSQQEILSFFKPGDVLVVNETKVEKRRVFLENGLEILFINQLSSSRWEVLFSAKKMKLEDEILFPNDVRMKLVQKGLPQILELIEGQVDENYFQNYGQMALPPYIQKARKLRETQSEDETWYQTEWAKNSGSSAAPTASLHFSKSELKKIEEFGVTVVKLTLHVGLGTFLPIKSEKLTDHKMHAESVYISKKTLEAIKKAKLNKAHIWALGSTVLRALESYANGMFDEDEKGASGTTDIFIYPGYSFKWVTGLLTNFHQPQSTLLAMIAAFSSLENVKEAYSWAIERKFKLFSYGDLTLWKKKIK
jgi:S-adenosylmethionine:tRNA ribosyltransferase-isomerase